MKINDFWLGVLRSTIVGIIVSTLLVAGIILIFGNTGAAQLELDKSIAANQAAIKHLTEQAIETNAQARDSNLAISCVLALPVDPVTGRDSKAYEHCFKQFDLKVPDVDVK